MSALFSDDTLSTGGVWVFAEYHRAAVIPVAYELLGKGRELADRLQTPLTAVLCGHGAVSCASTLIQAGADVVIVVDSPLLECRLDDDYCQILYDLVQEHNPEILLFGATSFGRSLAPRLAARLRTGLTADCTVLGIDQEKRLLLQTRPAFGGNLMATIICQQHRPQMATVRPGVMQALTPDLQRTGRIISKPYDAPASDLVQLLSSKEVTITSIAHAKTIVAVGRGIGSAKNVNYARELAELLGGELGCSRPVVDIGWCEYKHQIGQTGCVVAPDLLISCGISGAIQHLAGMANAKTIVAINSDPDAPIFELAHYKIVGDCVEMLRELIAQAIRKNPPMDIA